jgi:hypothetical protein
MNRIAGFNRLVHVATESIQLWARDIKGMRSGILIVIHSFSSDMEWHPEPNHLGYAFLTTIPLFHAGGI